MIISFPRRPLVTITAELVSETRRVSATGTVVVRHAPPVRMFFLDYDDGEGFCGLWDGPTYAGALAAAREWAIDGVSILDRTSEVWGRA